MELYRNNKIRRKENTAMPEQIMQQLEDAGYDYALAFATQFEIDVGAACGQLSIINGEE